MVIVVAVTRKVQRTNVGQVAFTVLEYITTLTHQTVDGANNVLFVTWDRVRAKDDDVAVFDLHVLVCA